MVFKQRQLHDGCRADLRRLSATIQWKSATGEQLELLSPAAEVNAAHPDEGTTCAMDSYHELSSMGRDAEVLA